MANISKFALSGFSRNDESAFASLFETAAARAGGGFRLVPEADAEALIIDADSIYGQMGLMQAQGSGKLLIAITAGSRADADHKLDSPVDIEALAALLSGLGRGAPVAPAARSPALPVAATAAPAAPRPAPATAPAARNKPAEAAAPTPAPPSAQAAPKPAASAPRPAAAPPPSAAATAVAAPAPAAIEAARDRSLFEYLQPGALSQAVQVQRGAAPLLVIDPATRTYLGGASLKPYIDYLAPALREGELKPVPPPRMAELEAQLGGRQPIQRLLWLAALHAGEGQLIGFDAGARFKLGKWPQIEREFPKHFRIATVMMKAPATVDEIAAASGASREEVCDLLNAYLATGFAEPEQAQGTAAAETARTGLLDRLRGLRG